jgi:hypothetical protein
MADDTIRARRIELEDENGDVAMVLDGASRTVAFFGKDPPEPRAILQVQDDGTPILMLAHPSGHTAMIGSNIAKEPVIVLQDPSEQNHNIPLRELQEMLRKMLRNHLEG